MITAVLSIPVIYAVGKVLSSKSTRLIAAFLLSINMRTSLTHRKPRSYNLSCCCACSLFFFFRMDHAGRRTLSAMCWHQPWRFMPLLRRILYLCAVGLVTVAARKRLYWKRFLIPVSATAFLILPALYYMAFRRASQLTFIPPVRLRELAQVIYVLAADAGKFRKAIALLYLVCCGSPYDRCTLRWRSRRDSFENWRILVVALCAAPCPSQSHSLFLSRYLFSSHAICSFACLRSSCLPLMGWPQCDLPWLRVGICALIASVDLRR